MFAEFGVQFHGLNLSMAEVEDVRLKLDAFARSIHPSLRFHSDVEVDLLTTAGEDKP